LLGSNPSAQAGADRAALEVAIIKGLPHGGWVTKGRKAEDGIVPEKYQLTDLSSDDYRQRYEMNVKDADGTLIITHGPQLADVIIRFMQEP